MDRPARGSNLRLQQSLRTFVALPSWRSIHPTRPHHALRKWRPSRRLRQVSVPGRLRSPRRAGGGEIASLNFQISASAESVDPTDFCNEIGPECRYWHVRFSADSKGKPDIARTGHDFQV